MNIAAGEIKKEKELKKKILHLTSYVCILKMSSPWIILVKYFLSGHFFNAVEKFLILQTELIVLIISSEF